MLTRLNLKYIKPTLLDKYLGKEPITLGWTPPEKRPYLDRIGQQFLDENLNSPKWGVVGSQIMQEVYTRIMRRSAWGTIATQIKQDFEVVYDG